MTSSALHNAPYLLVCTLSTLLLPLLSFCISLIASKTLTKRIAPAILFMSVSSSVLLLLTTWNNEPIVLTVDWFAIGDHSVNANIAISNIALLMLTVVSVISFLVHVYSVGYMEGDPEIKKYFAMLGFFTFSMQGIILSDNLLVLFIFWELVGFSSYMLIGHWMEKPLAAKAAKKAFLINRIGDAGFLIGLMIIWSHTGTFNLAEVLPSVKAEAWQTAASLCIFCGVMGKSAQFPLFTWLPDAMEGPTPVSALIHAATMVAAGVYLLVRVFPIFSPDALTVVACTGMITAILAALAALFQYDIKRVLAYSTISQLGLMVMALGLGIVNAALLHLLTHAFFKACLFLSAGSVIHALHRAQLNTHEHFDVQDIRNMGGLKKNLPVTFFTFLLGGASLAGIPFFSGFLSKEAILSAVWMNSSLLSWIMLVAMISVSFITVLYTFRLIWYIFIGEPRKTRSLLIVEVPTIMRVPVILLALCSLWLVVSWNPFDFIGWLLPKTYYTHVSWITIFSILWIGGALFVAYFSFRTARFYSNQLFENAFYFDVLYKKTFGRLTLAGAAAVIHVDRKWIDRAIHGVTFSMVIIAHVIHWIDKAIVDGLVNGLARASNTLGSFTRSFQGGKIQVYIFWAIFAIIIFLIYALNK